MAGASDPIHEQRREKQDKSRGWVQRGVNQGCPHPATLHHCVRVSIQGVPHRLSMGADDLMISSESMEELLVKVQTWKTEMAKKAYVLT